MARTARARREPGADLTTLRACAETALPMDGREFWGDTVPHRACLRGPGEPVWVLCVQAGTRMGAHWLLGTRPCPGR